MDDEVRRARLSKVGLAAYFRVVAQWGLDDAEARRVLGDPPEEAWQHWRAGGDVVLGEATLSRISHVLGIYAALVRLLGSAERGAQWLRSPNTAPIFENRCALSWLTSGSTTALRHIRDYLDAQFEWG